MKRILREDHVKLLLHALSVLFLGLCILFSGGIYESMGVLFSKGGGDYKRGRVYELRASLNKFTGEIRINRVVCDITDGGLGSKEHREFSDLSDSGRDFCKAFDSTYD